MALPADIVRGAQAAEQQAYRTADAAARKAFRDGTELPPGYEALNVFISGGAAALTTGTKSAWQPGKTYVIVDYAVVADQTGDLALDLGTCDHADYPTAASIVGVNPPTITAGVKTPVPPATVDLSDWTTTLHRGRWLVVAVTSATDIVWATLALLLRVADRRTLTT